MISAVDLVSVNVAEQESWWAQIKDTEGNSIGLNQIAGDE